MRLHFAAFIALAATSTWALPMHPGAVPNEIVTADGEVLQRPPPPKRQGMGLLAKANALYESFKKHASSAHESFKKHAGNAAVLSSDMMGAGGFMVQYAEMRKWWCEKSENAAKDICSKAKTTAKSDKTKGHAEWKEMATAWCAQPDKQGSGQLVCAVIKGFPKALSIPGAVAGQLG